MTTVVFTSSGTWTAPAGITTVEVQCWAEGGDGGTGTTGGSGHSGGGGGGGEFAQENSVGVTPATLYTFTIGSGGSGNNTIFTGDALTVTAHHGGNASGSTPGAAGTGSTNTTHYNGGTAGSGITGSNQGGGGGGGGAGSGGAGGAGHAGGTGSPGTGGAAGTPDGGAGGQGGSGSVTGDPGSPGSAPGGGGGGGSTRTGGTAGGAGLNGQITLTYSSAPIAAAATLSGSGTLTAAPAVSGTIAAAATLSGSGTLTASPGLAGGGVVNQWATSYSQIAGFGTSIPALQSAVTGLNPSYQVAPGTGTPTAGNWLFCLATWNENGLPAATIGVGDDIHSFWRPGNEANSTWAVSAAAGKTRTAIWYTPNLASVPQYVYAAPSGPMAAISVLVIEVAGLGPWDTVTGVFSSYAAAATSLSLPLGAPSATAFIVGATGGDNTAAGQAFAPSGWFPLVTTSTTNGSDHTCDSELTAAVFTTSGSVSVSGTASSAENLSGVLIGVLASAPSPVPAANNPNWPYLKFEAAFGGGFQTPPDQLTWYDLTSRLWSWDETTGVQYQLGQIQATNLDLELDNFDNALASDYPGSPYYSNALNANMSFQSGASPWTASGTGAAIAQSAAQAWSSSPGAVAAHSLQVTPDGSHATPGAISEKVAVSASTAYSASAWFYSSAGYATGAKVAITWYTSGGSVISTVTSGAVAIPAATWTQVGELNQTSPSNAAFAAITAEFSGTPPATAFWVAEAALNLGAAAVATGLVTTGVPLRIRAAIGTLGGVTSNRWYVIQRNAEEWPQQIDPSYRRKVSVTATDIWSAMSNTEPTPYRGETAQDNPYAVWAMDDQPLEGGVQPASLRNSAPGNTNVMTIYAASSGVTAGDAYTTDGLDATTSNTPPDTVIPPSIATYAVAQQAGWMYGDPQASNTTYATSNPVTASPGSAAWQQAGLGGNTGSNGWFMAAGDTGYPPLSGGMSLELWFNAGFFGTTQGWEYIHGGTYHCIAGQPYAAITLATLATSTATVAVLQLTLAGHLNLITYNGATPTTSVIYSSSDLRSASWHQVVLTTDGNNWHCYVNGGLTATASGTGAGMTSAWTWLVIGADLAGAGGSSLSAATHMGNVAYSQAQVYPQILPAWRVTAHYSAAATGFGLLPAPQTVSLTAVANRFGTSYVPDGSAYQGSYGSTGSAVITYSFSGLAVATAGGYTSGPSARATTAGLGQDDSGIYFGNAVWLSFTGLAPSFTTYTAASADAETSASTACGSGDSFTSGYGASAAGTGVCSTGGGSGASPPAGPSALGDTVSQRIERNLYYGKVTYPGRCADPASSQVQAATDIGGQQNGINVQNIVQSDGGLMFIDNVSNLTYWQRSHLASQYAAPAWNIGPGQDPYYREIRWLGDPQRIWNAVVLTPYSPDGATLPLIGPTQATQVTASQEQFGAQPKEFTNYLQSQAEMQTQANWLFANYGTLHIRAENVKLDAAPDPALWVLTLGINVADVVTAQNWQIAGGGATWTFRVSEIRRRIVFGEDETTASVTLKLDFEPSSYYS